DLLEDFANEMTEAESQALEALPSSQPEWQREVARKMADAAGGSRVHLGYWLARAAAVLVAAASGWWAWDHWMAKDPSRLIAQAYTQQRPFEYRVPGADRAPVRTVRGGVGSSLQRPAALLEAEAMIARELEKNPDSGNWLALRARAELLAWDAEAAIATLVRALERKPDDPDLLADLGMAYAIRAEARKRDVDYASAIEYLGRSLKAKPNSLEALFNRALVYERMFYYDEAARDWRQYIELDTAGAWREEAQRHLADIEQKKKPEGL